MSVLQRSCYWFQRARNCGKFSEYRRSCKLKTLWFWHGHNGISKFRNNKWIILPLTKKLLEAFQRMVSEGQIFCCFCRPICTSHTARKPIKVVHDLCLGSTSTGRTFLCLYYQAGSPQPWFSSHLHLWKKPAFCRMLIFIKSYTNDA